MFSYCFGLQEKKSSSRSPDEVGVGEFCVDTFISTFQVYRPCTILSGCLIRNFVSVTEMQKSAVFAASILAEAVLACTRTT